MFVVYDINGMTGSLLERERLPVFDVKNGSLLNAVKSTDIVYSLSSNRTKTMVRLT